MDEMIENRLFPDRRRLVLLEKFFERVGAKRGLKVSLVVKPVPPPDDRALFEYFVIFVFQNSFYVCPITRFGL